VKGRENLAITTKDNRSIRVIGDVASETDVSRRRLDKKKRKDGGSLPKRGDRPEVVTGLGKAAGIENNYARERKPGYT